MIYLSIGRGIVSMAENISTWNKIVRYLVQQELKQLRTEFTKVQRRESEVTRQQHYLTLMQKIIKVFQETTEEIIEDKVDLYEF